MGMVNDIASTNKKPWIPLYDMFPSCYFQGCCFHGFHLCINDIFTATNTKKTCNIEAMYPTGYLFQEMLEFIVDCKDVIKLFHSHHVVNAQLQELHKATND